MTDICLKMSSDGGFPEKCREARRRRIEVRRSVAVAGEVDAPPRPGSPSCSEMRTEKSGDEEGKKRCPARRSNAFPFPPLPPAVPSSSSSASGSSTGELLAPDVPSTRRNVPCMPRPEFGFVSLSGRSREMEDAVSLQPCFYSPGDDCSSTLHFFAVFDGHGGSHVKSGRPAFFRYIFYYYGRFEARLLMPPRSTSSIYECRLLNKSID